MFIPNTNDKKIYIIYTHVYSYTCSFIVAPYQSGCEGKMFATLFNFYFHHTTVLKPEEDERADLFYILQCLISNFVGHPLIITKAQEKWESSLSKERCSMYFPLKSSSGSTRWYKQDCPLRTTWIAADDAVFHRPHLQYI